MEPGINVNLPGGTYSMMKPPENVPCEFLCLRDPRCVAYTKTPRDGFCHLKNAITEPVREIGALSVSPIIIYVGLAHKL